MAIDFNQAIKELEAVGLTMQDGFYWYGDGDFGGHWNDAPDQATIDARNALILLVKAAYGKAIDHADVLALQAQLGAASAEWLAYVDCRDDYVLAQREALRDQTVRALVQRIMGDIDQTAFETWVNSQRGSLPYFSGKIITDL